jgi:hypothetical protein
MRKFTTTSLVLVTPLVLGSFYTSAFAGEVNSFISFETVQGTQANTFPADDLLARNKPRVPGGSGCDDPDDLIEHPECRPAIELKDQLLAREASEGPRGGDRPGEDNGGRHGGRG